MDLDWGGMGSWNSVKVLNGAKFFSSTNGYYSALGDRVGANYNSAVISGVGSEWIAKLIIMVDGQYNSILVEAGGSIESTWSIILGARSGADNKVIIDGAGSSVVVKDDIYMGCDWYARPSRVPKAIGSEFVLQNGATCAAGGDLPPWTG